MATDEKILAFVIEETGQDPLKVTLDNHDAPMGAPRKQAAFNLGGENARKLIRLTGRTTPIIHTEQTKYTPHVIKGHLRDHFAGIDGHAQDTQQKLEKIRHNMRICNLTCGVWSWVAFPQNFTFGIEGPNDITYELHFDILAAPGFKAQARAKKVETAVYDIIAEMRTDLAAQKAALLAQFLVIDTFATFETAFETLDGTMDSLQQAATAFENAPAKADAEATFLRSKASDTKDKANAIRDTLNGADPTSDLTSVDEGDIASFQREQYATLELLQELLLVLWRVEFTANQRIRSTTRLYQVAPGDTLEQIAALQLGSAARAQDLGYKPSDLIAGRLIRIPA